MFFQFEGLCVDAGINIAHLKGSLEYFAREYFGQGSKTRLRPFHFQFTEPSFEVDISCAICKGSGMVKKNKCKLCKSGWLELGGCGMVHPNVLKAGKIDWEKYSGWAFGFGIERIIMMKYGIEDIRYYYNGDIRFLEQF
jgi:phenylalanyl-tRNA synthetase alpha chain